MYFFNTHFYILLLAFSLPDTGNMQQKCNFYCLVFTNIEEFAEKKLLIYTNLKGVRYKKKMQIYTLKLVYRQCNVVHVQTIGQTF